MFQTFLYNPLFNALVFLYNTAAFQDLGLAIIFLTIVIRIIFMPLFYRSTKNQILLQRLQPELAKIQHDHKDDREKQAQAMMDLYKKHNVNPFSGFLLLLIQLPVLIALYRVFFGGFSPELFDRLYSFVLRPEALNATLLGLIDLAKPSILMVSLAAVMQYIQGRTALLKTDKNKPLSQPEKMAKQMIYFGPVMTVLVLSNLPSAIGLYWLVTSAFSVVQQVYINKTINIKEEKKEHGAIKTNN
ncbi:MAG: membrane protein insertase YidC [Candidatus Harrisonbacteria bacterium]|nr:membrane protein insertase YidC [Candidatus Harrisonbacteria bacterium]